MKTTTDRPIEDGYYWVRIVNEDSDFNLEWQIVKFENGEPLTKSYYLYHFGERLLDPLPTPDESDKSTDG